MVFHSIFTLACSSPISHLSSLLVSPCFLHLIIQRLFVPLLFLDLPGIGLLFPAILLILL